MNTFNGINEDEYVDLEATVFESIEEIISDNILKYSNPTFYEKLVDAVFEIFFEEWLAYVKSEDNLADLFTKCLGGPTFFRLRDALMG